MNSVFIVCQAASIGSIKRRYGTSDERAKEYAAFCLVTVAESAVIETGNHVH